VEKNEPSLPDTNTILRYLLNDEPDLAARAGTYWESVREGSIKATLTEGVLMECVYVLQCFYKVPRDRIVTSLSRIISFKGLSHESLDFFSASLEIYGSTNFDFVDCMLAARELNNDGFVFTFDDKLNSYISRNKDHK